jgi:cellulose synthase/poly-beta-1,6-N-acetylglucosamine synthase-like glycosyltransferase
MAEQGVRPHNLSADGPPSSGARAAWLGGTAGQEDAPAVRVSAEPVFRWWDYVVFIGLSSVGLAAIWNFAEAWVWYGNPTHHPLFSLLVAALLVPILGNQQGRWFLLLAMRRPRPLAPSEGLRVAVVTTCVPGAEPCEMLVESLAALVAIGYPHDTWLLDEGGDPEIARICDRLGVHYFSRRGRPEYRTATGRFQAGSKHGNYNAWLDVVGFGGYDVLAAFDADHVPLPDFLTHVLGYFRDPTVGYVQPAQAFYNQRASFVARGAAEETYAYHSMVQMASYGIGYPVIVGGHNTHRMSALKAVGGFAAHDADDLLITLRYRTAGWQGVYVPRILARGMVPVDWRGYLTQQRRWARSVLDLKLRRRVEFAAKLPLASRVISFLHGINFLYRHVALMVTFVILLWMLAWGGPSHVLNGQLMWAASLLCGTLALQELYRQYFYLDWRGERGIHWRSVVVQYASWPWFMLALVDVLLGRRPAYAVTSKSTHPGRSRQFIGVHFTIVAAVVLAWLAGVMLGRPAPTVAVIVAGLVVLASLSLIATELRGFPPPWNSRRRPAEAGRA